MSTSGNKRIVFLAVLAGLSGVVGGFFLGGIKSFQSAPGEFTGKTITTKVVTTDVITQGVHKIAIVKTTTEVATTQSVPGQWVPVPAELAPAEITTIFQVRRPNEVWAINREFQPVVLNVPVGTTVAFVNMDDEEHTITFDNGMWDMRLMSRDASANFTFREAGTFTFYCDPHRQMTAAVVVK